ncbi:ATP-binding protein [Dyella sp. 20L07]|uniref:ATP-binding protein n=1 Tax=Dyella sp. 20L07 TaxID=3384240 RepID=UPI003D2D6469
MCVRRFEMITKLLGHDHPTAADAILDRLLHNRHAIELKGDSMHRRAGTSE